MKSKNDEVPAIEANGARIPLIGLGTWDLRGKACASMVEPDALPLLGSVRMLLLVRRRP